MLQTKYTDGWDTLHYLRLTRSESQRVFLDSNESSKVWRRNGGEWVRFRGISYTVLKPEIDQWLRATVGHRDGETWECDRYYYPDEELPELPKSGNRSAWKERFICYEDREHPDHANKWSAARRVAEGFHTTISFFEGRSGHHPAERLPLIFALMFL